MKRRFNKHIIVVGSARSGTSWLCELLARPHRYRLLYEPEHEFNTRNGHLLCDKWIDGEEDRKKENGYLKRIFQNRVDNNWIAQHSNRKWKRHLWPLVPKMYVIKFVRCNLAADYVAQTFQIPVLHIIRNPYDVIESQLRVRFPWLYDLSRFQTQIRLVDLVRDRYDFDLENVHILDDIEKLAVRWCLENIVALEIQKHNSIRYKIVKFEEMRNNKDEYVQICNEFSLQRVSNIDVIYDKPSSKSHSRGLKGNKPKICTLEEEELKKIGVILQKFGLERYPIR